MPKAVRKKKTSNEVPLKLNLACGQNPVEGFTGVDRVKTQETDIVHDLLKFPWPFEDDSVEEVMCSHFVEHIPLIETKEGIDMLIAFMNELHRVMKKGGKATIICPYYSSVRAAQDPTHRRFIAERTFLYFNQDWLKQNKLSHYDVTADFDFTYGYIPAQDIVVRSEEYRNFAFLHYINAIDDIQVVLIKR